MKYNLDDLHWQEFEILSFKILQNLISQEVQFIEGGNDKGRDILHDGNSNSFQPNWTGKWLFQVKHKSKSTDNKQLVQALANDLKVELEKVFITNQLQYDNYILITNKTIDGALFDGLHKIFLKFKNENSIVCENFNIISYRHFESCIDNSDALKWSYPNIINHPDFRLLISDAINYKLETRKRGWLNGLEKQREKFVFTQFFQKANDKLKEYPAIILSGPPRSGKTFNAEILALNFSVFREYQPILIDDPEEIETSYEASRNQIFICDDAFGKHSLSYRAEEWFKKLDRIFNLADNTHLFIFTSREYIFRAFINYGNDSAKTFLEKIIVESHNYSSQEKLSILKRHTVLSLISEEDKISILENEEEITDHRNFSPETIRAFFAIKEEEHKGSQLKYLREHLRKPDAYLSTVFFKLNDIKQAALLSVLCSTNNSEHSIHKSFESICSDLQLNYLIDTEIEFDELDDSILRILKSDRIEEIKFYHPSMQEFLIRQLISNETGKLREIVLKNLNLDLLSLSLIKPSNKSWFKTDSEETIHLVKEDLSKIETGLGRFLNNREIQLYDATSLFKWFNSENHSLDLKINDRDLFNSVKSIISGLLSFLISEDFYFNHKDESCSSWTNFLFIVNSLAATYNIKLLEYKFPYFNKLFEEKREEEFYWMLVFRILSFTNDNYVETQVGKQWLNEFYTSLKNNIYELGYELFDNDFPDFNEYKEKVKKDSSIKKRKHNPNRTWFPRFLDVKIKFDILKEIKGTNIGNQILSRLTQPYEEIKMVSEYAKNRHGFIIKQGWWNE